jgi:putative transcriptional regulator
MVKSLRGQLLIASRSLLDPNFLQSVVLLVEHNDEGAMGLVVNRPSEMTVSKALGGHFEYPETDELVYLGGPVEQNSLFILHDDPTLDQMEHPMKVGVYVGTSEEAFEEVVRRANAAETDWKCRIISGYAGWSPGQLEGEIARLDWKAIPASPDLVFHTDPYLVWQHAMQEHHKRNPLVPDAPGDPRWN